MAHSQEARQELSYLDSKTIWLFFFTYFLRFVVYVPLLAVFIYVFSLLQLSNGQPQNATLNLQRFIAIPILWILTYTVISSIFAYIFARLTYSNWKYQLTEDALRIEKGIIWKKYVSIPYEKIQNVDILRGLLTRILRLSDLQIQTAGISGYALTEGRLPGLSIEAAEQIRDNLVKRSKGKSGV